MAIGDEVLVAIMNSRSDFSIARDEHWYRIPVVEAQKWIGNRWPPKWLAFYQTKAFDAEQRAVNYYAEVQDVRQASRRQLFPEHAHHPRAGNQYYQLMLGPLERLSAPIVSRRKRKIVFIRRPGRSSRAPRNSTICSTRVRWRTGCGRSSNGSRSWPSGRSFWKSTASTTRSTLRSIAQAARSTWRPTAMNGTPIASARQRTTAGTTP
jgi:hypothetical protein